MFWRMHFYYRNRRNMVCCCLLSSVINLLLSGWGQQSSVSILNKVCDMIGLANNTSFFSHEFHKACIDPWLLDKRTCPMCKLDILKTLAVPDPEATEVNNSNRTESRSSTPFPTSLSGSVRLDSDAVELTLVRSGSESRDPGIGCETCENVSSGRLSPVVATVQVIAPSATLVDDVFDDDMAHNTVIDIETEPSNESNETSSDVSSNSCETDQLASVSSHTLTSQTSDHPYDSTDCLI